MSFSIRLRDSRNVSSFLSSHSELVSVSLCLFVSVSLCLCFCPYISSSLFVFILLCHSSYLFFPCRPFSLAHSIFQTLSISSFSLIFPLTFSLLYSLTNTFSCDSKSLSFVFLSHLSLEKYLKKLDFVLFLCSNM